MKNPLAFLAPSALALLAGCASQPTESYPATAASRLATYDRAMPCCDDPSAFRFIALPKQGYADATVGASTPVFDFQSGLERTYQRFYVNIDREAFDRWLVSLVPEGTETA